MRCLFATALVFGLSSAATADVLTCDGYRTRLEDALHSVDANTSPPAFKLGFSDPVRGSRLGWDAGQGLSGNMSCGPANQFQEFDVDLQFDRKQTFGADMKRLVDMQAAAICALSSSALPACAEFGRGMLREVLQQMGGAFKKGAKAPTGLSDKTLFGSIKAELVSSPTLVSFLIGPGRGNSVDDARQPLPEQKAVP